MELDGRMTDEQAEAQGGSGGAAKGCLWIVALVIGLPAACTAALSLGGGGGDNWSPTPAEARSVCEGWVKDKLKSPATADFTDGATTGSGGTYTVGGEVDSQNSFGALVRSSWSCDVRYDSAAGEWRGSARLDP